MKIKVEIVDKKNVAVYLDNIENLSHIIKKEKIFPTNLLLVTYQNLWNLYKKKFESLECKLLFLPEGEKIKSFEYFKFLCDKFFKLKLDRKSLVVVFGGGVLGDLVGFVCSVYMRGINYIQIPTTLLAMVDAAIGGKTAVNLDFGKNLIGSFYQPKVILCDISLLKTLPQKEIYNGLGEILKYSIINKKIFKFLSKHPEFLEDKYLTKNLILECVKTKLNIVKKDEKEITGLREKLNLGHTIAHAIEAATYYKTYSHGEAVILGLVAESYISLKCKILSKENFKKIINFIESFVKNKFFEKKISSLDVNKLLGFIKYDKKYYKKNYRFVLPLSIGNVKTFEYIKPKYIKESIEFLKKWLANHYK